MDTEGIKEKIERVISNNHKLDEVILDLEKSIKSLTEKRNALKEDVAKLNEQVVNINRDLSNSEQIKTMLEQEIKTKSTKLMGVAVELEQIKWQYTWHGIIAENQTAELKLNYNRMEALSLKRNEVVHKVDRNNVLDIQTEKEIEQLTSENNSLEQQIFNLQKSLTSKSVISETEKEISFLQERNNTILKRMKCQLAQLEYRNTQDFAYLKSLKENEANNHTSAKK